MLEGEARFENAKIGVRQRKMPTNSLLFFQGIDCWQPIPSGVVWMRGGEHGQGNAPRASRPRRGGHGTRPCTGCRPGAADGRRDSGCPPGRCGSLAAATRLLSLPALVCGVWGYGVGSLDKEMSPCGDAAGCFRMQYVSYRHLPSRRVIAPFAITAGSFIWSVRVCGLHRSVVDHTMKSLAHVEGRETISRHRRDTLNCLLDVGGGEAVPAALILWASYLDARGLGIPQGAIVHTTVEW